MFETVTTLKILHTELKSINNGKLVDLCLDWRDKKIDESPNATGYEDSKIPDDPEVDNLKNRVMHVVNATIDDRYYLNEIWAHILQPMQSTMIHSHRSPYDRYLSLIHI